MLRRWTMDTDVPKTRTIIANMRQSQAKPDPASLPFTEEDIQIPVRDGRSTGARVYIPRHISNPGGLSGFVVFHGRGYAAGDFETRSLVMCSLYVP